MDVYLPRTIFCYVELEKILEISQNLRENTCARISFLIKLQAEARNFIKKETLAQVFSCEFCEISKNTFFTEHLRWLLLNQDLCKVAKCKISQNKTWFQDCCNSSFSRNFGYCNDSIQYIYFSSFHHDNIFGIL